MKISFLHAGCGDWVGMYVDGVLKIEDHSLDVKDVIRILYPDIEIESVWSKDDFLERYGNWCPEKWEDIDE